ncbi:helix-turn-helix transcriptional regulator [Mesorhizobium sp. B4-1-3]|uniref:helix-turn-helix domain-containing protein n=1 Tax=Mesorhizobium sp. B4-1-3 TaxID=2589889 RepID=UPI001129E270|nr:AraC family transcriptional regulator [Mesorhizobium sp. B4-1-3]TPI16036.1 helix-turn-helix transcriptional regulator [Mesorhizobium sp. B4-1-3]
MCDESERHRQDNRSPALHFEMVRRRPAASLAGIVTDICGYREILPGHFSIVEYASLTVPLVISFAEAFAIGLGHEPGDNDLYASFAAGLYAGPVIIKSFGGACCVQVNFTPLGARQFFGLPMSELRDRMVGLDDALGFDGIVLREQLGEASDWHKRFDIAEGYITRRLAQARALSPEVAWAYRTVVASGGRTRISALAGEIGWSRKHLAAKFTDAIGIGPKTLSRIVRFNRALSLSKQKDDDWAGIAADCGYADQAHLVREFRQLAGETPTGLAALM